MELVNVTRRLTHKPQVAGLLQRIVLQRHQKFRQLFHIDEE
jgi:hypothetical protein